MNREQHLPSSYRFSSRLRDLIPLLWHRLGSGRWVIVLAFALCLSETILMMAVPLLMEVYFNLLGEGLAKESQWLMLRFMLLTIVLVGTAIWGHYMKQNRMSALHREVTLELADHAQRLPLVQAQASHSADLQQRINHDSNRTAWVFATVFHGIGTQVVMLALACIYMLALHWQLAVGIMVLMPLGLLGSHLLRHPLQRIGKQVGDQEAAVRQCQQDALQSIETIKAFGAEHWMEARFVEQKQALNKLYVRRMWWQQLVNGLTNTLALTVSWGSVLLVAWLAVEGKLQLGSLMAFFILIWRVFNPLLNLGRLWGEVQETKGSAARVAALWQAGKEPRGSSGDHGADATGGGMNDAAANTGAALARTSTTVLSTTHEPSLAALSWRDITFRYAENAGLQQEGAAEQQENAATRQETPEAAMLEQFDLAVPAASFTAIVGPSGSGKSTVAKLGAGLLFPNAGHIDILGSSPLEDAERSRQLLSYVPQNPYLFAGSIRDNLLAARPDATEAVLFQAAQAAQAHAFIEALPDGFDTRISEHGSSLSGGQRQRLAIARALLADRPIWILDEATSALDLDTERRVMEAVLARTRDNGRTLLVIAHRLTAIQEADRIIAMENGRIAEQGTHRQLLQQDGLYRKLWSQMHEDSVS